MAFSPEPGDASNGLSFSQLVFSDFPKNAGPGRTASWPAVLKRCLYNPGMLASIILRAQQCLYRSGRVGPAWALRQVGIILVGADFVPGMTIGTGLWMPHPVGVAIGNGLRIGNDVMLAQGATAGVRDGSDYDAVFPTICDGATIWAHATIVGGVRIGAGAEVGANSLVVADVPDHAIVVGVPARKIGETKRPDAPEDESEAAPPG